MIRGGGSGSVFTLTRGMRESESRAEVVDDAAEAAAVEHFEPPSNGWGYRGVDVGNDLPCDGNRTLQHGTFINRAGILSVTSTTSVLVIPSV